MKITFSFGKNWKNYVKNVVNEKVIEEAKKSLERYEIDFYDKTFIDVGCGSGLFSLSALLLRAKKVISFDIDKESIEATNLLKTKFKHLINESADWDIFCGDILDRQLVMDLSKKGDIVYSWGVLHHTGRMHEALVNVSQLVKDSGYLILAIYNHAPSSQFWLQVKQFYNIHRIIQPFLILLYGTYVILSRIVKQRTLNLRRERGMHIFYDAIDWLGGYPYEFACFEEIEEFLGKLGFVLKKDCLKLPCGKGVQTSLLSKLRAIDTGNNEFVFQKLTF